MNRSEGFTLLEMLVALSVLAVLFGFLFLGLTWGARTKSIGPELRVDQKRSATMDLVHRMLSHQKLYYEWRDNSPAAPTFVGSESTLEFVTTAGPMSDQPGEIRVRLIYQPGFSDPVISLQRLPFEHVTRRGPDVWQSAESYVLFDDLTAAAFSYYGVRSRDDAADWHDEWFETHAPILIKLDVRFADKRQPVLIVPVGDQ
ncbi:MAG: prepilin-type N-terminal cleavage/methylation domain-containing protein [Pseudomonadota bacterium]